MREKEANAVTSGFMEAVLHPEAWPEALSRLASVSRAPTVFAQIAGPDRYSSFANPGGDSFVEDYMKQGWHLRNPRMKRGIAITRTGFPGLITLEHAFSPEELARQPFQQEFASRYELECEAGMVIAADVDTQFILTLQRSARVGPYFGGELRRMDRLMEGLKVACQQAIAFKVGGIETTRTLIDATGEAYAFLSWTGRVVALSSAFEASHHRHFRYKRGHLHMAFGHDDTRLQAALSAALRANGAEMRTEVFPQQSGTPLVVHVTPVMGSARDLLGSIRAIVTVPRYSSKLTQNTASVLRAAFSLTEAETRLALRIGNGHTLADAAAKERVTLETARTRLKAIFRKTGTHRQLDLVILLDELQRR